MKAEVRERESEGSDAALLAVQGKVPQTLRDAGGTQRLAGKGKEIDSLPGTSRKELALLTLLS